MGGTLLKFADWLATRSDNAFITYSTSIIIPSSLASVLVFGLHSMRGTPEPLLSTIPIALISFAISPILAVRSRKIYRLQLEKLAAST